MNLRKICFLFLITSAFFLRIYQIDRVPPGLYYDEVDYGYQARSLLETGRDYRGTFSPFYVHSFNDIRAPLPAYFTALTTKLFEKPEFQVRMPFAITGTLSILLIFLIINIWTGKFFPSFLTALIFTVSPWQIQFSRFSHEVMVMQFIFLCAMAFFCLFLKKKKFLPLLISFIFFSLSLYAYRTMSFYAPLMILILLLLFRKKIFSFGAKKIVILFFSVVVITVPFLIYTTIKAPDTPRINQLAITSDPTIPIWIQRNRELDSGDLEDATLGKKAVKSSYVFHNKPLSWAYSFLNNYLQTFSADFLFLKGDPNPRHSIGNMGELYFIDIFGLIFGLYFIAKNFKFKEFQLLFLWFLTSPIPAALTFDGAKHGARLFIFSVPLLIIVGFGWWTVISKLRKVFFGRLVILFLFSILFIEVIFYYHRYLVHYPVDSARHFGYGFKQVMTEISQKESAYKKVMLVPDYEPPMIYYLFWSHTNPKFLQEYGSNFSVETIKNQKLDKYKVSGWTTDIGKEYNMFEKLEPNVLYLVTKQQLPRDLRDGAAPPSGVRLLDLVTYPDKDVAFYLIDRDPNYKP